MRRFSFFKLRPAHLNWRYVLGELAIVVTGILIAFGVNNWGQARQERAREQQYLLGLVSDLQRDSTELSTMLGRLQQKNELARQVIGHFYRELPGRDTIPWVIFRDLSQGSHFVPYQTTYQMLLNSGDLALISDFSLRNEIVEHYTRYTELEDGDQRSNNYTVSYSVPYFMHKAEFSRLPQQADTLLADPILQNIVYGWFGIYRIQTASYQRAFDRCVGLLQRVQGKLSP